jgi:hypothetical protein
MPISINRYCCEINSEWLIRGLRGRYLDSKKREEPPIEAILTENLKRSFDTITSLNKNNSSRRTG